MRTVTAVACFAMSGCFVTTSPEPTPEGASQVSSTQGTLVVDWSISGTKDPSQCQQSSSSAIEIIIVAATGAPAGTYQQACTAFATSIALTPGRYSASATLVQANGTSRTTTLDINPFTILGNDRLDIPIDFPASSFR